MEQKVHKTIKKKSLCEQPHRTMGGLAFLQSPVRLVQSNWPFHASLIYHRGSGNREDCPGRWVVAGGIISHRSSLRPRMQRRIAFLLRSEVGPLRGLGDMEHLPVTEIPAESRMSQAKGFSSSWLIFFLAHLQTNLKFKM